MVTKCLHCFEAETDSADRTCNACRAKAHRSPIESCPACPYAKTRQAMGAKPVNVKPAQ